MIKTTFTLDHHYGTDHQTSLYGSMNNWKNGFKLINNTITLYLVPGTYEYKFLRGNIWFSDNTKPIHNSHYKNNVITVYSNDENIPITECFLCASSFQTTPGIEICQVCKNIVCYDCSYKIYQNYSVKTFTPGTLCCPFCKCFNEEILVSRIDPQIYLALKTIFKNNDERNKNYMLCTKCNKTVLLESRCTEQDSNEIIVNGSNKNCNNGQENWCDGCKDFFDKISLNDFGKINGRCCPGCNMFIIKKGGCNHMTHRTSQCVCEWCYYCGGIIPNTKFNNSLVKDVDTLKYCYCGNSHNWQVYSQCETSSSYDYTDSDDSDDDSDDYSDDDSDDDSDNYYNDSDNDNESESE
jgi:hypothetical protein